jgi:hypothetical protein
MPVPDTTSSPCWISFASPSIVAVRRQRKWDREGSEERRDSAGTRAPDQADHAPEVPRRGEDPHPAGGHPGRALGSRPEPAEPDAEKKPGRGFHDRRRYGRMHAERKREVLELVQRIPVAKRQSLAALDVLPLAAAVAPGGRRRARGSAASAGHSVESDSASRGSHDPGGGLAPARPQPPGAGVLVDRPRRVCRLGIHGLPGKDDPGQ